jgi:hypothetical protein
VFDGQWPQMEYAVKRESRCIPSPLTFVVVFTFVLLKRIRLARVHSRVLCPPTDVFLVGDAFCFMGELYQN